MSNTFYPLMTVTEVDSSKHQTNCISGAIQWNGGIEGHVICVGQLPGVGECDFMNVKHSVPRLLSNLSLEK